MWLHEYWAVHSSHVNLVSKYSGCERILKIEYRSDVKKLERTPPEILRALSNGKWNEPPHQKQIFNQ